MCVNLWCLPKFKCPCPDAFCVADDVDFGDLILLTERWRPTAHFPVQVSQMCLQCASALQPPALLLGGPTQPARSAASESLQVISTLPDSGAASSDACHLAPVHIHHPLLYFEALLAIDPVGFTDQITFCNFCFVFLGQVCSYCVVLRCAGEVWVPREKWVTLLFFMLTAARFSLKNRLHKCCYLIKLPP